MNNFVSSLTGEQRYFYDYHRTCPNTTVYNHAPLLMKLIDDVDTESFIQAIMKTLAVHPAYSTLIDENNGNPVQKYVPDIIPSITSEKISYDELMSIKDDLIQPFSFSGEALCRFRLFITERGQYLFFDDHHIVCDGIGKIAFLSDLEKIYNGQEVTCDSWFKYLQEREAEKLSPKCSESIMWYQETFGSLDFCGYPNADFVKGGRNKLGVLYLPLGLKVSGLDILRKYRLSYTNFFSIAALLSTAEYNHNPSVLITWCSTGRYRQEYLRNVGMMLEDIPLYLNSENMTLNEIFSSIRRQSKAALIHSKYMYTYLYTSLDAKSLDDENICVIYQSKLWDELVKWQFVADSVNIASKKPASENILDIEIMETEEDDIMLRFNYAAHRYKPESMERYSGLFIKTVHDILKAMNESRCEHAL